MKIIKYLSLLISIILLFSSCDTANNGKSSINSLFTAENPDYIYGTENSYLFNVGDDGMLYYVWQDPEKMNINFTVKNLNGETINKIEIEEIAFISAFDVEDTVVYYTLLDDNANSVIYYINLNDGEKGQLCTIDNFNNIKNLAVINGTIYFIGIDELFRNKYYNVYNHHNEFIYNGERIKSFNIKNKKIEDINIHLPISFSKTADKNLMIYAYDDKSNDTGGYYFEKYNLTSGLSNDKIYNNSLMMLSHFAIDDTNKSIIYKSESKLKISDLTHENKFIELGNDIILSLNNNIIYKSGYIFYNVRDGIRRIMLDNLINSPIFLNVALCDTLLLPDIEGYEINYIMQDYDEFVLSVLAGNNEADLYLIFSTHGYSDNIRSKGAFVPLNNVLGVSEYLDKTFPYVKDAAINENGDIWMLPLEIRTLTIEYNENIWKNNNLDITALSTIESTVSLLNSVKDIGLDETYHMSGINLAQKYFYQLLRKNSGFNRDDFKKMALYFYDFVNYVKEHDELFIYSKFYNKTTKTDFDSTIGGLLFALNQGYFPSTIGEVVKYEDYDYYDEVENDIFEGNTSQFNYKPFRRSVFPSPEGINENDVNCIFISVNQNSKNLDYTLEYISKLSNFKSNEKNNFIIKDKSSYDDKVYINDLYDIFNRESFISFYINNDIFYSDFIKYLGDEITLDKYLNTIEFKINAYLNE